MGLVVALSAVGHGDPAMSLERQAANDVIRLTNVERAKAGLQPVLSDPVLEQAAAGHSTEMRDLHYFAHESPNANVHSVRERFRAAGGRDTALGENLSKLDGYPAAKVAEASVQGWMHSPEHRVNMLDPDFNRVGVSVVFDGGRTLITQDFAVRALQLSTVHSLPGGATEVAGQVVCGSHHLAVFSGDDLVLDFDTTPDGHFDVTCPLGTSLGLGQLGAVDHDEATFKIVSDDLTATLANAAPDKSDDHHGNRTGGVR
ncbi:MAG TPA: CAP domain-containing protein [Candidatus Xenobia bacterium]